MNCSKKSAQLHPLPSAAVREYWSKVAAEGCIITGCGNTPCIHHAKTGAGGRKDDWVVLPLCHHHHQGKEGIHTLGRKLWQAKYGTEDELLIRLAELLGMP